MKVKMSELQLVVTSRDQAGSLVKRTPKLITGRGNIFHIFGHKSPFWHPISRPLTFEMCSHSFKVTLQ